LGVRLAHGVAHTADETRLNIDFKVTGIAAARVIGATQAIIAPSAVTTASIITALFASASSESALARKALFAAPAHAAVATTPVVPAGSELAIGHALNLALVVHAIRSGLGTGTTTASTSVVSALFAATVGRTLHKTLRLNAVGGCDRAAAAGASTAIVSTFLSITLRRTIGLVYFDVVPRRCTSCRTTSRCGESEQDDQ